MIDSLVNTMAPESRETDQYPTTYVIHDGNFCELTSVDAKGAVEVVLEEAKASIGKGRISALNGCSYIETSSESMVM